MHYTQIIIILFYIVIVSLLAKDIFEKGQLPSIGGFLFFILFSWGMLELLMMNTELLEDILVYMFYFIAFVVFMVGISFIFSQKKGDSNKEVSKF